MVEIIKQFEISDIETSVLPRTHGSSLFTSRRNSGAGYCNLGSKRDEQMLDNLEGYVI